MSKNGLLIILSGLPGSGKSTLSKMLATETGAIYLRIDTIEQGLQEICKMQNIEAEGYRLSYRIAKENLLCGNTVIADSVNPIQLSRDEWNAVAKSINVPFINIEVICSDIQEHRKRIETRGVMPGTRQVKWEDVQNKEYDAWQGDRIVIDTAHKTIEDSFKELLSAVNN